MDRDGPCMLVLERMSLFLMLVIHIDIIPAIQASSIRRGQNVWKPSKPAKKLESVPRLLQGL